MRSTLVVKFGRLSFMMVQETRVDGLIAKFAGHVFDPNLPRGDCLRLC